MDYYSNWFCDAKRNQSIYQTFTSHLFRKPMSLNRQRLDLTITQASTFSEETDPYVLVLVFLLVETPYCALINFLLGYKSLRYFRSLFTLLLWRLWCLVDSGRYRERKGHLGKHLKKLVFFRIISSIRGGSGIPIKFMWNCGFSSNWILHYIPTVRASVRHRRDISPFSHI